MILSIQSLIIAHTRPILPFVNTYTLCGEERRRKERTMSICLTWVPFCELGEPKLYHNLEDFTMCGDFTWKVGEHSLVVSTLC